MSIGQDLNSPKPRGRNRPPVRPCTARLENDNYFKFYSSLRCNAQELVWRSILPTLERQDANLHEAATQLSGDTRATLEEDPDLEVPRYVTAVDVHLMPGNYHADRGAGDVGPGALYDHGLAVFSMGYMGSNLDDIGRSVAGFVRNKYPEFRPATHSGPGLHDRSQHGPLGQGIPRSRGPRHRRVGQLPALRSRPFPCE